jgi:primosomal protein N' (replication factor Y)
MIYEVVVDLAANELDRTFDYQGENIAVGSRVVVSFGKKRVVGFVVGEKQTSQYSDKLKSIERVLDVPIVPEMLALSDFMRAKYNLRHIDALRLFIPPKLRSDARCELVRKYVKLNPKFEPDEALSALSSRAGKQRAALLYLIEKGGAYLSELTAKFGAGASALIDKELAVCEQVTVRRAPKISGGENIVRHKLTDAQKEAAEAVSNGSGTYVLFGVTGSGKTEVYQNIIESVVKNGKTAIMLVPEISLTPQIFKLFRSRFSDGVAILHSGLSEGERHDEWARLYSGEAKIAIGARSAVFAPLKNLGVIICDEEHDGSYISESNPRYDTRVIAEFRAKYNGAPLLLGSATPEIDTFHKAQQGEYKLLTLPERFSKFDKKDIEIVDMGAEFRSGNRSVLSYALTDALSKTFSRGEQAMLFLNRRGYASFLMCKQCGYIPRCEDCDINLTYHRAVARLKCHFCGKNYTVPQKCPKCGSPHIRLGRTGTEQVVTLLKEKFPDIRVLRLDLDSTGGKGAHSKILDEFASGRAQALVGTQMLAKGHDFPNVTLVGILDVDFSLFYDDYRASERTFQLVTQVAGRAGRAEKEGRVLLQTFVPSHYVFRLAKSYDYKGFFEKELNSRRVTKFPPFSTIVRVLFSSDDDERTFAETKKVYLNLKEAAKNGSEYIYLNAMRSPVNRIMGKHRYQILARIARQNEDDTVQKIYALLKTVPSDITCFVELNPQNLR